MKFWASLIAFSLNVAGVLGIALAALGFGIVIQLLAAIHSELEHGVDVLKWQRRGANRIAAAEVETLGRRAVRERIQG